MPSQPPGDGDGDAPVQDAACIVLVDRSKPAPRILLGRRLASQIFLPNKWVFPGGRVEPGDRALANLISQLSENQTADRARLPFALAALREMFEEAGIVLAEPAAPPTSLPEGWQTFAALGQMPAHDRLTPLARAITPPGHVRRFDTWFFLAERLAATVGSGEPDGELLDLGWFTLEQVRDLDLPHITRLIVDDVASVLNAQPSAATAEIPFYFQDNDVYRRTLIGLKEPICPP